LLSASSELREALVQGLRGAPPEIDLQISIAPELTAGGLDPRAIRETVLASLARAGMTASDGNSARGTREEVRKLVLEARAVRHRAGFVAFFVALEYRSRVLLPAAADSLFRPVWSMGTLGMVGASGARAEVMADVRVVLERFIQDFSAANPTRPR
jgi:hypothetical protein